MWLTTTKTTRRVCQKFSSNAAFCSQSCFGLLLLLFVLFVYCYYVLFLFVVFGCVCLPFALTAGYYHNCVCRIMVNITIIICGFCCGFRFNFASVACGKANKLLKLELKFWES